MSDEFEKTIIGHLIRFPERDCEITEGIYPEDFSSPKMAAILRAVQEHLGKKYDPFLLSSTLKGWGWDISVFDLVSLEDYAFEGIDLERIKTEIKTEAQKRNLLNYIQSVVQKIKDPVANLPEIHNDLSIKLLDLQTNISTESIIRDPAYFREEILNPKTSKPILTGLKVFDNLLGGFRPNELSIMTGETGSGKTTFATAYIPFLLAQRGNPVLIASFEMKPPAIQRKMVQMVMKHPFYELKESEKENGLDFIEELPLHFINAYGQMDLKQLRASIFKAYKQFHINFVVLDHLHFFLKYQSDHERQAIDAALVEIKTWTMILNLHIIIVVHPTKLTYDNKVVHLNDLKGSSGLKQIPDNVLSIWRPRDENDLKSPKNEIVLHILKVRDDSGDEGKVILTFDKRSQSYTDSGPDLARSAEGKMIPESPSPRSRILSGKDFASGYDS